MYILLYNNKILKEGTISLFTDQRNIIVFANISQQCSNNYLNLRFFPKYSIHLYSVSHLKK